MLKEYLHALYAEEEYEEAISVLLETMEYEPLVNDDDSTNYLRVVLFEYAEVLLKVDPVKHQYLAAEIFLYIYSRDREATIARRTMFQVMRAHDGTFVFCFFVLFVCLPRSSGGCFGMVAGC